MLQGNVIQKIKGDQIGDVRRWQRAAEKLTELPADHRGQKRAAIAVAHTLLVIIYHLLKEKTTYQERSDQNEAA